MWAHVQQAEEAGHRMRPAFAGGFLRDAIAVASPSLEAAIERGTPRAERALLRYLIRAGTRATPFGLFATVDAVPVRESPEPLCIGDGGIRTSIFPAAGRVRRDERDGLAETVADTRWTSNPSLYRVAGTIRLLVVDHDRGRTLTVSLAETGALATVLRLIGVPRSGEELIDALAAADPAGGRAEAGRFVVRLARLGVLVASDPNQPARFPDEDDACEQVVVTARLDSKAERAPAALRRAGVHVTAHRPFVDGAIDKRVVDVVLGAAHVLRALAGDPPDPLAAFRRSFGKRFEGRAVGLLEALDPEVGLDLTGVAPEPAGTLLQAAGTSPPEATGLPAATVALQLRLLERAWAGEGFHQELGEGDLPAVTDSAWPVTMAAVVRLSAREPTIAVETVVGPSGARMFGRSARSDARVGAVVAAVARAESAQSPGAIHAELAFLPPDSAADTVVRPCPYPHRIVFEGGYDGAAPRDIPVRDVLLLLRRGRLLAIHAPSGGEIVPHVTHTARHEDAAWPPAHRVLALLEPAGAFESLRWRWGALGTAAHLPRVSSGGAILCRERWNLTLEGGCADDARVVEALRDAGVPLDVDLEVEGEPPLALRLNHRACRDLLRERLQGSGASRLVERWPLPGDAAVRSVAGAHAHEAIIPLRTSALGARASVRGERLPATGRPATAVGGVQWLELRIACAPSGAGALITETLAPLVARMRSGKHLARWHFVRIRDGGFHLRLRLAAPLRRELEPLRAAASDALAPLTASGHVLGVSEFAYVPETHRYGEGAAMALAEEFFELDSDRVVEVLRLLGPLGRDDENLVHAAALDCVAKLRAFADADADAALTECHRLIGAFGQADRAGVDVRALWRRHDRLRARLRAGQADRPWRAIAALLEEHEADVRHHAVRLDALKAAPARPGEPLVSYVHMASNRLFRFQPGVHEAIAYELVRRHLTSPAPAAARCS